MVKVADFSALDHSIISPLLVRASHGAEFTCGMSQVLLAGVSGGFYPRKKKDTTRGNNLKKTHVSM